MADPNAPQSIPPVGVPSNAPNTPSAPVPAAAPSGATGNFDWSTQGLDSETLGYVQNKGFKNPGEAIISYRNLEKLQGVPADQIIRLPKGDDVSGWQNVWKKLGAGETVDAYKIPVPAGDKGEFATAAKGWFHELGVPVPMATKLAEKWNAHVLAEATKTTEAYAAKQQEAAALLKNEWGAAHDQNVGIAKQAAKAFGLDGATVDKLESVLGFAGTMKLFHNIGSRLGEGDFVTGTGQQGGFDGRAMTPDQAKAQITALRADAGFVAKFTKGDLEAKQLMERLHKYAYPE